MDKDDDDRDEGDAGMSITRYQIMPSLISLLIMRNRLHLAYLGKKLMKWTAVATGKELRRIAMEIGGVILKYEILIKDAFIMLAQCRFHLPGVNTIILETAPKNAMITFASSGRSIAGVKVVSFEVRESGQDGYAFLGMGKGGEVIRETKERWRKLVKILIVMCQFRENFILTDAANKAATKKQNVLKRLIVPKITETIKYILSELDEQEREESFRLKRFKQLKYKNPKEESETLEEEPEPIREKPKPIEEKPEPIIEIPKPIEVKPEPIIEKPEPIVEKPEPIVEKPEPIVEKPEPIKEIPTVTVVPAIIPEPPQVEQPKAETPEVDLIMSHINEVVKLADLLRSSAMLPKHFGLTKCDLGRLKIQLDETIKLSKTAKEDRECVKCEELERTGSPCTCPASVDAPIKPSATQISKEPPYFEAAPEYQAAAKTPTLIPEYILKPRVIPDIEILKDKVKPEEDAKPEGKMNLDELEKHIDQVLCMTYCYKQEKLLSASAEDFLKCCHSVKNKLQEVKIQRQVKAKIGLLKDKVEHLEKVTNIVEQDLSTTSISSFMSCCQEFKVKLERRQSCRGAPSVASIENLVKRIDLSIVLGKEAIKEGLVSESVEEFISTCTEIKEKIDPQAKPKPKVIKDLLLNVTDIIKQISKYKDGGELSNSIEKLFTTCETTKAKLDCYKPPQICPNKVAKQALQQSCKSNISGTCLMCDKAAKKASQQSASCPKCDAAAKKASQQSLKAKSCENCLICDEAAKKVSQQSLKPKTSSTCPKCDEAAKKQSRQSRSPKSSASCPKCDAAAKKASQQSLKAESCVNCLICDEAAKKASQQSLKPKTSSTCPKCDEAAKKQSRKSRSPKSSANCPKCDAAAKKASQQSLKAESCVNCLICDEAAKKASQQSLKPKTSSTCPKCDEAAKKQSRQSRSPKSSASCPKCDAAAKKASQQSLNAKSCENCLICDEAAKKASQQSLKPKTSSTCPKCDEAAKKQSRQSRSPKSSASCQKCDAAAKKASQQSLKAKSCENCLICDEAAKKASQQSLKQKSSSTCPKCDEAAKKKSQQSRSPKSSASCQKCDAAAKKASHQSLKAKSCENCLICDELAKQQSQKQSYGPKSFTTCLECDKGAKQQSQTSCKSTPKQIVVPVKKRSCVCSKKTQSRSNSTYSKADETRGKSKSRECCSFQNVLLPTFVQISVNQQSKRPCILMPFQDFESDCIKSVKHRHSESNICRSACYNKDQKVGLKRNAMSMVILKTFKNINSSDKQTVTEFPLPYKLEKRPSQMSSHPTGFCESVESTNSVSLCNKSRTKGFIQTVKNIKSEKLICCQDLSKSYLPFLWPHSSVDTLISQERNNESNQENPFF